MSDMPASVLPFHGGAGERECGILPGVRPAARGEAEVLQGAEADVPLRRGTNHQSS